MLWECLYKPFQSGPFHWRKSQSALRQRIKKKIGWCIFLMTAHKTSVPSLLQTLWLCCQGAVKASRVLHSMVRHLNGPHIKFPTHSKADEVAGSGVWCNAQTHPAEILQKGEVIAVNTDTNAEQDSSGLWTLLSVIRPHFHPMAFKTFQQAEMMSLTTCCQRLEWKTLAEP